MGIQEYRNRKKCVITGGEALVEAVDGLGVDPAA
jgi:hypothetical protein